MTYNHTCPACGDVITGDDRETVAMAAVEHAREVHARVLPLQHVLGHLTGDNNGHAAH